MMELIFDRTIFDVERWRTLHDKGWDNMSSDEQSEWMGSMKGRYTHTDMNRVENAVGVLSQRLRELGYIHPTLTVKTDWAVSDVPTVDDMRRYFGNVDALRRAAIIYPTTPPTPTVGRKLNYSLANDVEKILFDIDEITVNIPKAWNYAGEIFAGEV